MTNVTFTAPRLETERLILRAPELRDAPAHAAFMASERSKFVGGPISAELAWRMLALEAGHWVLKGFGRWILEEKATGDAVGIVGLWHPVGFPEDELGWDLFDGATGKGYATEAATAARAASSWNQRSEGSRGPASDEKSTTALAPSSGSSRSSSVWSPWNGSLSPALPP